MVIMSEVKTYVLIKDFNKMGSAVMGFGIDKESDLRCRHLLCRCLLIAKSPIQVVKLGGPNVLDVYAEYAPYWFTENEQDLLDICITGQMPDVLEDGTIVNFPIR